MLSRLSGRVGAIVLSALLVCGGLVVPSVAQARVYSGIASWGRTNIGTGWASKKYTHIFNAGDLDGNGFEDMMLTDTSGDLWFYPTSSATSFKARQKVGYGWKGMKKIFGGIDFNGDGNVDILGISNSGVLYYYPGLGTGRFASKVMLGSGWGSVANISATQTGFNGKPIIMGSKNGVLYAWSTNGRGAITGSKKYGTGWSAIKLTAITGDVSGDGVPDMWAVSNTGDLRLYVSTDRFGSNFVSYSVGSGWAKVKYFLPRVDDSHVIRAIFPDGALRQYSLTSVKLSDPRIQDQEDRVKAAEKKLRRAQQNLAKAQAENAKDWLDKDWNDLTMEQRKLKASYIMIDMINEYRAYRGLNEVPIFVVGMEQAQAWADQTIDNYAKREGWFEYAGKADPTVNVHKTGSDEYMAENVAVRYQGGTLDDYDYDANIAALFDQWVQSGGHNSNLLNFQNNSISVGIDFQTRVHESTTITIMAGVNRFHDDANAYYVQHGYIAPGNIVTPELEKTIGYMEHVEFDENKLHDGTTHFSKKETEEKLEYYRTIHASYQVDLPREINRDREDLEAGIAPEKIDTTPLEELVTENQAELEAAKAKLAQLKKELG